MGMCLRKIEPRWLWYAVDHVTNTVLAYVFSRRKDEVFKQLKELLSPFDIKQFYTDDWGAYERHPTKRNMKLAREIRKKLNVKSEFQNVDQAIGTQDYLFFKAGKRMISLLVC